MAATVYFNDDDVAWAIMWSRVRIIPFESLWRGRNEQQEDLINVNTNKQLTGNDAWYYRNGEIADPYYDDSEDDLPVLQPVERPKKK